MGFIKRLFGGGSQNPALNKTYSVQMDKGNLVPAVYVNANENPSQVLNLLNIPIGPRPAIFITGGASNMTDDDKKRTQEMFEKAIAPFAEKHQITVIDGATKSGVIEMMAMARLKGNFTFPLIGIAPLSQITYSGKPTADGHALCPGHSHFVFVTGDKYGAESEMIVYMSHTLAGGVKDNKSRRVPAIGIVINGGQITRQEAYMATTKHLDIPLIVLEGSGRFADELASAARTGETSQALLRAIIARGNIQLVSTVAGPESMLDKLNIAFNANK